MSVQLDLPQNLRDELTVEASQLKISLTDYILDLLEKRQAPEEKPKTGAELVAYWKKENLIGSRPDIQDSQTHAQFIRKQTQTRLSTTDCSSMSHKLICLVQEQY